MKIIIKSILAMFGGFICFYLMGCFIENSFNISLWTSGCRSAIGIFGGLLSMLFGLFIYDDLTDLD